ncbi:hypothetical protein PSCICE_48030 [Pseudomonas cichorii]|nr:hypothetical protein PSCICE_48030 [Pseudomonas cichorii]
MISLPNDLPHDPVLLKQLLLEALNRQEESAQAYQTHIVDLKEQIKLLRDRLFGRKSEQSVERNTPQLALFNEPESESMSVVGDADEEVVKPTHAVANASRCRLICRVSKSSTNCPNTN